MPVVCTSTLPLATPSRDARATPINLTLGASRFATTPQDPGKESGRWPAPAGPRAPHTPKNKGRGYNKYTRRGPPASRFSPPAAAFPPAAPTSVTHLPVVNASRLSPLAPAFTPAPPTFVPARPVVAPTPATPSASTSDPSPPPDSPEAWAPGRKDNPNAPKKEHIIFVQRLFKQGLKRDAITTRALAEYPNLCKGHRNGVKVATEETRVESVAAVVFQHTISYADWYV